MNNSLGIWFDPNDPLTKLEPELELHINLWKLKNLKRSYKESPYFLDIGLLVTQIENIKNINIYTPFNLEKYDIVNLGDIIGKDEKLLSAIFNVSAGSRKQLSPNNTGLSSIKEIQKLIPITLGSDPIKQFLLFCFDENDFEVEPYKQLGSIIKLNTNKDYFKENKQEVYFRFRLYLSQENADKISSTHSPTDKNILSSISKKEIIDFRVNENRNIPQDIQDEKIRNCFTIKKIHFFHIRQANDELLLSNQASMRYRGLEDDVWINYVNLENRQSFSIDKVFAYHWKETTKDEKDEIESFTASAKYQFQVSSFSSISRHIVFIILVSVISSILASLVFKHFNGPDKNLQIYEDNSKIREKNVDAWQQETTKRLSRLESLIFSLRKPSENTSKENNPEKK